MSREFERAFWAKVTKSDGCWQWVGPIRNSGYGTISLLAHRLAYELMRGGIPRGMCVLHTCDNRRCVNPEHLVIGTQAENTADMMRKGRHAKGPEHRAKIKAGCPRGEGHWMRLHPEWIRRGNQRGNPKLTEAAVRDIRSRPRPLSRDSVLGAAKEFGVSITTIRDAITRRTWSHLP